MSNRTIWCSSFFSKSPDRYLHRSFVQVGCLISILLLGIGPISQQAVSSRVCSGPANGQQATISVAFEAPNPGFGQDLSLMGGIVSSLASPNQNQTALVNGCSTGNCTFPEINGITHSTIGMCSRCIDISSELRYLNKSDFLADKSLPNGLPFTYTLANIEALNASGGQAYSQLDSILSRVEDHDFEAIIPASIFNWTMITSSGCSPPCNSTYLNLEVPELSFLSTACSIYPCMRHYAGLVDGGVFNETLVSTVPAPRLHVNRGGSMSITPYVNFYIRDYYVGINASCVIDGNNYYLTRIQPNQIEISQNGSVFLTLGGRNLTLPSQCINKVNGDYIISIATFLADVLTGNCWTAGDFRFPTCYSTDGSSSWWLQGGLYNSGDATLDTVQSTFDSVVEVITNRMRVQSTGRVYGTVFQTTTCVSISWRWLLFPALLIIVTVICLVITMVQPIYAVETPFWKSSILPLLYASPGTQLMSSGAVHNMEAKSKVTIARLETNGNKWTFVEKSMD